MKKLCLTLGAALVGVSGFAAERILYQQNFETIPDAAAAGWSFGGASMTIASDEFGKFLDLALGQNNGRSGMVKWGQEIFLNENGESVLEDGTYNVAFDVCIKSVSTNQVNSGITIFTNHEPVTNQGYRLPWSPAGAWNNFIVNLEQTNTTADASADMTFAVNAPFKTTENEDGSVTNTIDTSDEVAFATGDWYIVNAAVNVNDRTVAYDIYHIDGTPLISGENTVPETDANGDAISMYAEGMYVMMARYQSEFYIDNIKISYESAYEFANDPTVALTRLGKDAEDNLNLNLRAYTITFLEEETLHVTGTDGQTIEVEYADCDGAYVYETEKSGTLMAWTTSGSATSQMVEVEVDCAPCVLPAATATISSVTEGFGKTYTLTVSNAEVPLQPTIFINYEFTGNDGETLAEEGVASGATVTVPGEGVLKVTTQAYGYEETTVSVNNDIEYGIKRDYDFARMSKEELAAAGFTSWNTLNSDATSGFNNWTARKRMYYFDSATEHEDEEGNTVYDAVYPFGFVSADNTENVMEYSEIAADQNAAGSTHFEGIDVYVGHNLSAIYRIGVYNNETSGGNNKNIDIYDLAATDVVVANKINNYGGNSVHPVVATANEYYEMLGGEDFVYLPAEETTTDEAGNTVGTGKYSVHVDVYRIDTACTRLTIYEQKGGVTDGVEAIEGVEEEVKNNDPWYYTIDGIRIAEPTRPGLYIHQGKKIIVKK